MFVIPDSRYIVTVRRTLKNSGVTVMEFALCPIATDDHRLSILSALEVRADMLMRTDYGRYNGIAKCAPMR